MEILFTNRRKERHSADMVTISEVPGWVILKNDGVVAEMISASVIKRIRFLPGEAAPVASLPEKQGAAAPPPIPAHLLQLPQRPDYTRTRPQPIVPSRRYG